jgi:hypothetical protein
MIDDQTVQGLTLRWNEPLVVETTAAVQQEQVDRVRHLLDSHPGLALEAFESAAPSGLAHRFRISLSMWTDGLRSVDNTGNIGGIDRLASDAVG